MAEIFLLSNELNLPMQGPLTSPFHIALMIEAVKTKLVVQKKKVDEGLSDVCPCFATYQKI
jgi:hypothetical protein